MVISEMFKFIKSKEYWHSAELCRELNRKFQGERFYFRKLNKNKFAFRNKLIRRLSKKGNSIEKLSKNFFLSRDMIYKIIKKRR